MITREKIDQAKQAIMTLNHKNVYCPDCGKVVHTGVVAGPLAAILLEALETYDTEEVRPRISQEAEDSDHKRSYSQRKGRPKKA